MPSATVAQGGKNLKRYLTPNEVELHATLDDCWVSLLGKVFDVTPLVNQYKNDVLVQPILNHAGKDISHWFTAEGKLKIHIDPLTGCEAPYVPQGRFLHVPPTMPRSDWSTDVPKPWWTDNETYMIGALSAKTRNIRIVNTLTKDEHLLEVCSEESLSQIQERYLKSFNAHAKGYMWKRMGDLLDMSRSLDDNGIPDESEKFQMLGIDDDEWLPVIHLYFSDDLTVA